MVLTNLQILTETAIQTILQTRILMFTGFSGNQKPHKDLFWISHQKVIIINQPYFFFLDSAKARVQLVSIISGHFMVAKACTVHTYFELSGKKDLPHTSSRDAREPQREKKSSKMTFCLFMTTIACRY